MKSDKPIENTIYKAILGHCEQLESKGSYVGNGHHLAQRLTAMVSAALLPKKQKLIYDAMTGIPRTTKEIADEVGMSTSLVNAQLKNICNNSLLVLTCEDNSRRKMWYKAYFEV